MTNDNLLFTLKASRGLWHYPKHTRELETGMSLPTLVNFDPLEALL